MPRYIVKLETPRGPRYLEWSTIVDAPVTYGMTLEDFKEFYRQTYGRAGMMDLDDRLKRVEATGCSAVGYATVDDLITSNRAGDDETALTLEEIIAGYCSE